MNQRKRKIYFLIAVIVFILATPLTILYSTGWRIDIKERSIAKTGNIFVSGYPKSYDIYVGGELKKKTSGSIFSQGGLVSSLLPGEHLVSVKKDGHQEWKKKLSVEANLVTEVRNIFLPPAENKSETLSENVKDFVFSESDSIVAYAAKDAVYVNRLFSETVDKIPLGDKERLGKISFVGERYLFIESLYRNETQMRLYDTETGETIPIKENEDEKYVKIGLFPTNRLAALSNQNVLYSVSIDSQNEADVIAKDVINFETFGNIVAYVTAAPTIVYEKNIETGETRQLIKTPVDNIGAYSVIIRSKDGNLAVINDKKELELFNNETENFDVVSQNIRRASFSPDGKKLLYNGINEISVYYLKDIRIHPYKNRGDRELITRFSEAILVAEWFAYDNEHILFSAGGKIKLAELDGRDQRNIYDMETAGKTVKMKYNGYDDFIYYLDNSTLKRITLLPRD